MTRRTASACLVLSLVALGSYRLQAQVGYDRLLNAAKEPRNWLIYSGGYFSNRYSLLTQITPANARNLELKWMYQGAVAGAWQTTPLVVDGIMYLTQRPNDVVALDAKTGRVFWIYRHTLDPTQIVCCGANNRGLAILGDTLFMGTLDAHLVAIDAKTGRALWNTKVAENTGGYSVTHAPLVVKDKVIVGVGGGEYGIRGFVAAYDAWSGKLVWRFWTIPAPGEFGSESWPGKLYLHGGGTTWMPGTFDPELNLLYWGTSNPSPDFDGRPRPGDDLYTDCVLALDPDTGKLKWYFQFTPHDLFDYDATETPVLIDAVFEGEPRKLLVEANRNGFLYVLDRTNGAFLSAVPFVEKLNWAKGIDERGRPIRTDVMPSAKGTRICPGFGGATNWYAPSYNPSTHLFYFLASENCDLYFLKPEEFSEGRTYYSTGVKRIPGDSGRKILMAYELGSAAPAWRYPQVGPDHSSGGTMTTAGGLVFFGDESNSIEAVDARTGAPLWHFQAGQSIHASPMSYALNGIQHVAIAAGSDVFCFRLP